MFNLTFNEIQNLINKKNIFNQNHKIIINNISTNSKNIKNNTMFIALKGKNFDGHDFIDEAITNGAVVVICNKHHILNKIYNIPIIFVTNTYDTMGLLAKNYREKYLKNTKIIAITGSVGKTTTKEIIAKILSLQYKICKTEKNFNNFIGVTKTIFNIDINEDIAIIEFGMSHKNEIDILANITKPNIVIITNIGSAHIENFNSKDEILEAKLEIIKYLKQDNIFIFNNDDKLLNNSKINKNFHKYNFSINNTNSNLYIDNLIYNEHYSLFDVWFNKKIFIKNCKINIAGKHNIYNALAAILVAKLFNIKNINIKKALFDFQNIELRQKKYYCSKNNIFIEDCYNASPESMKASFEIINQYSKFKKILILGKMNELGNFSKKIHNEIGKLAAQVSDFIIFVGKNKDIENYIYKIKNYKNYIIFENCEEVVKYLYVQNFENSVFLIKGSRSNKMEQIILKYNLNNRI